MIPPNMQLSEELPEIGDYVYIFHLAKVCLVIDGKDYRGGDVCTILAVQTHNYPKLEFIKTNNIMTTAQIIKEFNLRFKEKLNEKSGWGKNEIVKLHDETVIEVLSELV